MKTDLSLTRTDAGRILAVLLLISSACLLVCCSHVKSQQMQYAGATHYAPGDPHRVAILRTEPTQPHERIGEVFIDVSNDPAAPINKVEERLRTEGAKMGADAVVIVYDGVLPTGAYVTGPYWDRNLESTSGRKLVGVAIKYR